VEKGKTETGDEEKGYDPSKRVKINGIIKCDAKDDTNPDGRVTYVAYTDTELLTPPLGEIT